MPSIAIMVRAGARSIVVWLLAAALVVPAAPRAQPAPGGGPFGPEELEQIAAPIALYPDPLLAQVLMAATYPLEVVLADRFVQANPGLKGEALGEALKGQGWDDSVKSLAAFPQVLRMMSERLEWTQKLGDAFLGQQAALMDAVQRLRARALAQGTLRSTEQQVVTVEGPPGQQVISILPASPEVVYVPMYSPTVVYGPWPYPEYPPYYYYPPGWPVTAFFTFGAGIVVGWSLWGVCDWHDHHVYVRADHYRHFTHAVNREGWRGNLEHRWTGPRERDRFPWGHDPGHRRGVDYRNAATRERFGWPPSPQAPAREPFRGRVEPGEDDRDRGGVTARPGPRAPEGLRGERERRPLAAQPPERRAAPEPPTGPERQRAREPRATLETRPEPGPPPPEPRRAPEARPAPESRLAPQARPAFEARPAPRPSPGLELRREPDIFRGLGGGRDVRGESDRGRDSRRGWSVPGPGIRSAPPRSAPPASPPPRSAPPQGGQRGGTKSGGGLGGGKRR